MTNEVLEKTEKNISLKLNSNMNLMKEEKIRTNESIKKSLKDFSSPKTFKSETIENNFKIQKDINNSNSYLQKIENRIKSFGISSSDNKSFLKKSIIFKEENKNVSPRKFSIPNKEINNSHQKIKKEIHSIL